MKVLCREPNDASELTDQSPLGLVVDWEVSLIPEYLQSISYLKFESVQDVTQISQRFG